MVNQGQSAPPLPVDNDALKRIIVEGNPEKLDDTAKRLGDHLARNGLTTSQIRNIYGTAKTIQSKWLMGSQRAAASWDLVMLKPKLEYQAKRHRSVEPLKNWLVAAINLVRAPNSDVSEDQRFSRFMDFFEATLAYHTASGGKQD